MIPQVLTLIPAMYPGPRREWVFGWYGIALGLASGLCQIIGGALIEFDVGENRRLAAVIALATGSGISSTT